MKIKYVCTLLIRLHWPNVLVEMDVATKDNFLPFFTSLKCFVRTGKITIV